MSAPTETYADYETPIVTDCLETIAIWAGPKIEALCNSDMSAETAEHVSAIIIALSVDIEAHRQAFVQMS